MFCKVPFSRYLSFYLVYSSFSLPVYCEHNLENMGKSCRVKQRTQTGKRKKVFCGKKVDDINDGEISVNSEDRSVNVGESSVNFGESFIVIGESSVNMDDECSVNTTVNTSTNDSTNEDIHNKPLTVSESKIKPIVTSSPMLSETISGYRLIDTEVLQSVFATLKCPECMESPLILKEDFYKKKGLASLLYIECAKCAYKHEFYTSRNQNKSYDVNKRMVYAMRSCGQGYSGIETFTTLMDMPKPMTANNYDKIIFKYAEVSKSVAEDTMNDAAEELRSKNSNVGDVVDAAISLDGSWQRRGHSSLNGCVTAIAMDTGRIIDIEAMSRYCRGCSLQENLKQTDSAKYDLWKSKHICNYNYSGSAGGMETEGARRIFNRSILKHRLRYSELYGDGDSKSHLAVLDTYPGVKVKKLQCVGHVQKRVGARLVKLKKDQKGLGGKGKLTKVVVDRLQNYYGIAIRQNVGNLKNMQSATRATLFHIASSKDRNYHTAYCPEGKDSWCTYQQDVANGTNFYKPGPGLPFSVIKAVKPIFEELSSEKLLKGCLHGKTQNHNECFNKTIWERLPKTKFVTLKQLEFGVYDALSNFNIGRKASILTYERMNMVPGKHMLQGCDKKTGKDCSSLFIKAN